MLEVKGDALEESFEALEAQDEELEALMAAVEAVLLGLDGADESWRMVNVVTLRVRTTQKRAGEWTGVMEVRARMERV